MKTKTHYKGQDFTKEVILTKPNESMELEEILARFVRHEPLQIGHEVNFFESEEDIEKLQHLDPVDKMAYIRKMRQVQTDYQAQENDRVALLQAEERQKFLDDNREKWEKEAEQAEPTTKKRSTQTSSKGNP